MMPHYLTNLDKGYHKPENVELAAKLSGQDVRYQLGPMPPEEEASDWYRNKFEAGELNHLDCIVGYEFIGNYSAFWRELHEIENK